MSIPIKRSKLNVRNNPFIFLLMGLILSGGILSFATGVFAQCLDPSDPRVSEGVISAYDFPIESQQNFPSNKGCAYGTPTFINLKEAEVDLSNYNSIKLTYYTKAKFPIKVLTPTTTTLQGGMIYLKESDMNLDASYSITGTGPLLLFVEGDLNIRTNITYGDGQSNSGMVVIVKGSINIEPSVTQINAVLIAEGNSSRGWTICSSYQSTSNRCESNTLFGGTDNQLIIKGNAISLSTSKKPLFLRSLFGTTTSNSEPAEKFILEPKYLVLLKDYFSHKLVSIYETVN